MANLVPYCRDVTSRVEGAGESLPLVPQNWPNCCIMTCVRVRCLVLSSHFQGFHHFSGRGSGGLGLGFISYGSRWCCCRCTCVVVGDDREEREELLPARSQKEKEKKSFFYTVLWRCCRVTCRCQESYRKRGAPPPYHCPPVAVVCHMADAPCNASWEEAILHSSTDYSASRCSGSIVQLPSSLAANRLGCFFLFFSHFAAWLGHEYILMPFRSRNLETRSAKMRCPLQ